MHTSRPSSHAGKEHGEYWELLDQRAWKHYLTRDEHLSDQGSGFHSGRVVKILSLMGRSKKTKLRQRESGVDSTVLEDSNEGDEARFADCRSFERAKALADKFHTCRKLQKRRALLEAVKCNDMVWYHSEVNLK